MRHQWRQAGKPVLGGQPHVKAVLLRIPSVFIFFIAAAVIPTGLWLVAIDAVGGVRPADAGRLLGVAVLLLPFAALGTGICAVLANATIDQPQGNLAAVFGVMLAYGVVGAFVVSLIGLGVASVLSTWLGLGLRLGDAFLPAALAGAASDALLPFGVAAGFLLRFVLVDRRS